VRSHEKRRAKLALADEDCQYDGTDHEDAIRLQKNYFGMRELRWSARLAQQEYPPAGCSKRLSSKAAASEGPKRTLWGTLRV
jgi:hypothetical protein